MSENRISKINVGGTDYEIAGTGSGVAVGTQAEIEALIQSGDLQEGDPYIITDDTLGTLGNPIVFQTYAAYQAAYNNGDVPVGAIVVIEEGNNNDITALQVGYGSNSNVKAELDEINTALTVGIYSAALIASQYFANGNSTANKVGSLVDINIDGTITEGSDGTLIMDIPAALRPSTDKYGMLVIGVTPIYCIAKPNGNVLAKGGVTISDSTPCRGHLTYIKD